MLIPDMWSLFVLHEDTLKAKKTGKTGAVFEGQIARMEKFLKKNLMRY